MQAEVLHELIRASVPDAELELSGKDCDFSVHIISPSFAGASVLERQKRVLAAVAEVLASGELHAINIKAQTPEEFASALDANRGLVNIEL